MAHAAQPGCERLASGACVPAGDEVGFEGWRPFTGQSFSRAAQRRVRGEYGRNARGVQWRVPGGLAPVSAGQLRAALS